MEDETRARALLDETMECSDIETYREKLIEIIKDELECVCTNIDLVRSGYAEYNTYPHDAVKLGDRLTELGINDDYTDRVSEEYNKVMNKLDEILKTLTTNELQTIIMLSVM